MNENEILTRVINAEKSAALASENASNALKKVHEIELKQLEDDQRIKSMQHRVDKLDINMEKLNEKMDSMSFKLTNLDKKVSEGTAATQGVKSAISSLAAVVGIVGTAITIISFFIR